LKSGDICEMVIVYRDKEVPQKVPSAFVFEGGLTPPK
jgi:hypothetical protein